MSTSVLLERLGGSTLLQRRRTSLGKELRETSPCLHFAVISILYLLLPVRIVRDCEKTKIASNLTEYTKMADALTDADYRQDFHRIILQLSTIILEDVIRKSGSYHYPRGIIEVHV